MKRYFVFVYEVYYPAGGMEDLKLVTDDIDIALSVVEPVIGENYQQWHIYDTVLMKIIHEG